jgi:ribosomal protein L7Ae-like RNA K-turn-binding protein
MSVTQTPALKDSPAGSANADAAPDAERLQKALSLAQLARKAGKAALGFEAAKRSLQHGECRLLILAADIGPHQHRTLTHFTARTMTLADKQTLGGAFALKELAVIAIEDVNFANGVLKILNR